MSSESAGVGLDATLRDFSSGQKVFNRYTLIRTLGRGGMGIVWLAHDEVLDRDVALKFLPEIIIHDRAVLEDLKHETKRSLELTHKNIIRIYDFVHDVVSGCISMEYIEGDTLSSLRADKPAKIFEPDELKPWLKQLCEALDYAHNHARIIHRDLKPSNLMISRRGDVKVADFGIARSLSDSVSMLTHARGTSGTLVYMSPQQLDGERGTHLDDIYSIGATIYELLTSKPPFYSGNVDRQIREKIAPSITQRRKDLEIEGNPISKNWEETVAACLAKDPGRRPQSVAEIAQRLQLTSPPRPPKLSKKKLIAALTVAGAAATILATIIVSAILRQREPLARQRKQTQQTPPAPTPTSKLEQTKKAAAQGDAEAQTNLAISYQNGIGVPKDLAKAAELYNHAADQGNAVAQNNLGRMYDKGIGVGKDLKKAVALYEKAVDQGNADAQNNLAFLYWNGVGVPMDLTKAMALYRQAADQGNTWARWVIGRLPKETEEGADRFFDRMFRKVGNQGQGELYAQLGVLYENGTEVPRDLKKAAELYQKAADDGNSIAQNNLANLYEQGKGVPRDYDKAVQLFQKAADQNYPSAQASLGRLYFYGEGVPQNLTKAAELLQKAADKGDSDAQERLGWMYQNGDGVPKDLNKAAELYRKAAEQGNDEAREHLRGLEQVASTSLSPEEDYTSAMKYLTGMNKVRIDEAKSVELLRHAADRHYPEAEAWLSTWTRNGAHGIPKDNARAEQLAKQSLSDGLEVRANDGRPMAQEALGGLYATGEVVPRDLRKAVEWYQKAADQGWASAQFDLGYSYANGLGVTKDFSKAAELFQKAADQGDAGAQSSLGSLYQNGQGVPKDLNTAAELYRKAAEQGNEDARGHLNGFELNRIAQQSTLRIADVKASETPDPNADTNLMLRISVTKLPNAVIDHTKVKIQVFFYDTVGDNDIKLTDANISYEWLTPNHDWADRNSEALVVTYIRPKNKGAYGQRGQAGHSKYLGYIVRVYYNDQLQDKRAEPTRLLNLFPAPSTAPPQ